MAPRVSLRDSLRARFSSFYPNISLHSRENKPVIKETPLDVECVDKVCKFFPRGLRVCPFRPTGDLLSFTQLRRNFHEVALNRLAAQKFSRAVNFLGEELIESRQLLMRNAVTRRNRRVVRRR
jgi:hypothetical protein